MESVILLPALISLYLCWRYSLLVAFLNIYLPVLFLLPDYFRWDLPGLPDPTFSEGVILPIGIAFFVMTMRRWKFTLLDALVLSLTGVMAISEYVNVGYKAAQNFEFNLIAMCLMPYMLAKGLIEPFGMSQKFGKRIVMTTAFVVVCSLYEFKFGTDPFRDLWIPFFPTSEMVWSTQIRWGHARIAGPFGSTILASIIFIVVFLLQQWLAKKRAWHHPAVIVDLGLSGAAKQNILSAILLLGVGLTMSRGPWLSLIFAVAVARIGWAKNVKRVAFIALVLIGLTLVGTMVQILEYASVGRAAAGTSEQETAAYRKELLDYYIPIAWKGGPLGYGRLTWPKVQGMPSVDNYFLLLMLMHGWVALLMLIVVLLVSITRLVNCAFKAPPGAEQDPAKCFSIIAAIMAIAISIATVYLDMQVMTLFYLLLGWSDGCVVSGKEEVRRLTENRRVTVPMHTMRVLT